jgi:uncharacterized transporter YbjL
MNKRFYFLLLALLPLFVDAQTGPAMADDFRSDGKIYVVISVIALIFISLSVFLVYLERKVSKLEKDLPTAKKDALNSRH